MKEEAKIKDNILAEPKGTMPKVGAMQNMQAVPAVPPFTPASTPVNPNPVGVMPAMPNTMPVQMPAMPNTMPVQMPAMANTMPVQMPAMPNTMPVQMPMPIQAPMICCPYLMNMQCPLTHTQAAMGMNMPNSAMFPGAVPYPAGMDFIPGKAGTGMSPAMNNPFFNPMSGMNF